MSPQSNRTCWGIVVALTAVLVAFSSAASVAAARPHDPSQALAYAPQTEHQPAESKKEAEAEHGGGWVAQIAKIVNFAILVGLLVYFLRRPIADYLVGRGESIRKDLIDAARLRSSAEQQLNDVRERLTTLPAELDGLRRRGQEELASERVRMKEATDKQREQLLERTRREIDLQFRLARRELLGHTAELAMRLARVRIERTITPEDQVRLIDRYMAGVQS